jgi:hypothetical protein
LTDNHTPGASFARWVAEKGYSRPQLLEWLKPRNVVVYQHGDGSLCPVRELESCPLDHTKRMISQ